MREIGSTDRSMMQVRYEVNVKPNNLYSLQNGIILALKYKFEKDMPEHFYLVLSEKKTCER